MKHQQHELTQMQSLPLSVKVQMTKRRISEWYDHWDGDVYVSFSGGKDSTVLKHIVDSMYDDVPSVFVNTGLEYPEIQKFAMSQKNVETIRPKCSFSDVIVDYGYPIISKEVAQNVQYARNGDESNFHYKKLFGLYKDRNGNKSIYCTEKWSFLYDAPFKISARCCEVMKKRPFKQYAKETGRHPIIGTMASESLLRTTAWMKNGCNAFYTKSPRSAPMSFWTEQDVLHYLMDNDVPYCSIYGQIRESRHGQIDGQVMLSDLLGIDGWMPLECSGEKRTGCIFCMFGCHLEDSPNRFQMLKKTHPKQYNYCIGGGHMVDGQWMPDKNGLGLGFVLDYIGVDY